MTPSSVACVCAVIEVIRVRPPAGAQLIAAHETGARARLHARSSTPYSKYPSPAAVASDEEAAAAASYQGKDLAMDAAGRIVAAGTVAATDVEFALARTNP